MNNDNTNPNSSASSLSGDTVASAYIAAEVVKARKDLKRSRIIGCVLIGFVGTYITVISVTLVKLFRPRDASQIVSGMIVQHVTADGTGLASQVEQQVPLLIRRLPDYAIEQLPRYRTQLQENLEVELYDHCRALSKDVGMQIDLLIDSHRNDIKELLTHANDRDALRKTLPDLDQTIATYLATDPDGRVIHRHITDLAAELKEVEGRLGRLAYGQNLTAEEQKARHSVAMLSKAIKNHVSEPSSAPSAPTRKLASK